MMEKEENMKKQNCLIKILSTSKAKYIIGTALLSGIGIALPRIFHVLAGSSAGTTFLPMHIAVLIAALTFGGLSASIVAGVKEIYADVISQYAISVLEENNIKYEYGKKVDYIVNQDKTCMCPMENKYKDESNINKIYNEMVL